jgi:hypothetical protein
MRKKLVALMALAMLAMASFGAAAAFAGGGHANPVWTSKGGTVLAAGKTIGIKKSKAKTAQVLSAPGVKINCTAVATNAAATLNGGEPGGDSETLTYSGCTVASHAECEVHSPGKANGTIETNALTSKLAFKSKASAEKEESAASGTVTVFTPVGSAFVEIELIGGLSKCGFVPAKNTVEGTVVSTNVNTGAEPNEKVTQVTNAVNQRNYFTNPGAVEHEAGLEAFGLEASYKGEVEVEGAEAYGVYGSAPARYTALTYTASPVWSREASGRSAPRGLGRSSGSSGPGGSPQRRDVKRATRVSRRLGARPRSQRDATESRAVAETLKRSPGRAQQRTLRSSALDSASAPLVKYR